MIFLKESIGVIFYWIAQLIILKKRMGYWDNRGNQ